MRSSRVLFPGVLLLLTSLASGQSVISVHSGLINYFEGAVFVDDHPLQEKAGTFQNIKEGSTLRTEQGRAEILLIPGVFLRLDQNSAIRMVSVALTNTRLEFLKGSAILDSTEAQPGNSPVVLYWACEVRFPKQGVYRLDSEPAPLLEVYSGEAEVKHDTGSSVIGTSKEFFFLAATETDKYGDGNFDAFYNWAKDRSDRIAADNQSVAQSMGDPGSMDNGQNFPLGPGLDPGAPPVSGGSMPTYGLGGPIYGSTADLLFGNGILNPYGPFGMSPYPYGVLWVIPRYRYPRAHSRWPERPTSSHWVPNHAGIARVHAGIPAYRSYTPYRPAYVPGAITRPYVAATPAARPVRAPMPHVIPRPMVAHPVGRR
jgi:hypothetical protein